MTQNTTANAWVGIDVSKDKLDACLLRENEKTSSLIVENTPKGFAKLLAYAFQKE